MISIETHSFSPFTNLAFEEFFLKSKDLGDDILMLYQNEPAVVVGRFQNTLEENNQSFINDHNILVARRISGGGAVYHDLGNLCYAFILRDVSPGTMDASKYIRPVAGALSRLGYPVEVTRRNDIIMEGKKVSGIAMALHKNRLLFHGTLLFDTDLDRLAQVLKPASGAIESKAIKSVRSKVANIKAYAAEDMDLPHFKQALKQLLLENEPHTEYQPSPEDRAEIQKLVENKYLSWDWTFGRNPATRIKSSCNSAGGALEIELELDKGWLAACHIHSDSLDRAVIEALELRLTNIPYSYPDVAGALAGIELSSPTGAISKEQLMDCLMGL
jgi:lipoate---protein ligase